MVRRKRSTSPPATRKTTSRRMKRTKRRRVTRRTRKKRETRPKAAMTLPRSPRTASRTTRDHPSRSARRPTPRPRRSPTATPTRTWTPRKRKPTRAPPRSPPRTPPSRRPRSPRPRQRRSPRPSRRAATTRRSDGREMLGGDDDAARNCVPASMHCAPASRSSRVVARALPRFASSRCARAPRGTWDRKQEAGVARRGGAFVMSYHAMPCHARGVLYPTHRYLRNQPTSHVSPVKSTYLLPSYLTMFDALPTRCGCYSPALFVVMGVIDRDARAVA